MDTAENVWLKEYLSESVVALQAFAQDEQFAQTLRDMADVIVKAFRGGNKLLIAGNGGSAGDSQHIAGEFLSRLWFDRNPLPAIALTTDTSVLTAVGNDYGYDKVFERQILGLGQRGDVFLGISTSGKSPNILTAFDAARSRGLIALGFCGSAAGLMGMKCDRILLAPSPKTSVIQQIHIVAAHMLCGLVERRMFGTMTKP